MPQTERALSTQPVLLYDGLCGFCNGWVKFVLKHDKAGTMRFAALQGTYAAQVVLHHPAIRNVDSIVLVVSDGNRESLALRSDALLAIASYLGGPWRVAIVFRLVPRRIRDWAYDFFARNRHRWFTQYHSCPIPDVAVRARFLP